ncbi:immunity 22 family protein [Deinococcus yunweiensis]|uniref:immunity 22 family protein n=1 Tax=Deinococcus yunweiensis TaxID=367282 RepID=UPI00398E5E4F
MTTYQHDTVTVWIVHAPSEEQLARALTFKYDDDDSARSPFSTAFRTEFYDHDFAEFAFGNTARQALAEATQTWLTLEEQVLPRLPVDGHWNALYVISGEAGDSWQSECSRPPMPHGVVEVEGIQFKLIGTFPVVIKY